MTYVHAKGMTTTVLLKRFASKARCRHSQQVANECWRELERRLLSVELTMLRIAWDHALMAEGPAELDTVVKATIEAQELRCTQPYCNNKPKQWGKCWKCAS